MYPATVAAALRDRGHDVQAVHENADLVGRPDDVVLAWAVQEGRVVVTENVRDFIPLVSGRTDDRARVLCVNARRWPRTADCLPAFADAVDARLREGRPALAVEWL
jgi:hypothetical protein